MLSSTAQTTLAAHPFRPYGDRPADGVRLTARELHARPSLNLSARAMLKHWPAKDRRTRPPRRPA